MPRSSSPPRDADDLLIAADVLGSFGVTPDDVGADATGDVALEDTLAELLESGRNRTAVLRRTIAGSDRGLGCAARYARDSLAVELGAVFESIDWSFAVEDESTSRRSSDRLRARATDHRGRGRETTFEYPETPLGADNLPAVLHAVETSLLAGTDARFVLLSSGVDRWQAALIATDELERLRDRYGPRITVGDRPLRPDHGLDAYVPDAQTDESAADGSGPWPAWAHTRERGDGPTERRATPAEVDSLIEEAEQTGPRGDAADGDPPLVEADDDNRPSVEVDDDDATRGSAAAETDGFELRGSPSVSRVPDEPGSSGESESTGKRSDRPTTADDGEDRTTADDGEDRTTADDGASSSAGSFGTLSGSIETARLSNDSFGTGDEWESENDRYRALGAALGAGGRVSVRGLLEDDDFLPELPAVEPAETRIEFEDPFDPGALREAKAAAEQSGFVWVDAGSLETTRVSNG